MTLQDLVNDREAFLALEPEEIAGLVLQMLVNSRERRTNRYNFSLGFQS